MIRNIILFGVWLFVWCLLSWPPEAAHVVHGVFVSLFVMAMTGDMLAGKKVPSITVAKCLWFVWYLIFFGWQCLKANIDVAYRVLHPDLPIKPATIRVKMSLRSDVGITFLANSITLTPGTTTIDVDKERGLLYVHCLSLPVGHDSQKMRLPIVERFEAILKRIFE